MTGASQTPGQFPVLLAVFAAGGLGAVLRIVSASTIDRVLAAEVPFIGTLAVNLLGCFVIGVCAHVLPFGSMRLVVMGGLLGGFTTYSAFALFTVEAVADGRHLAVAGQITAHLVGGVAAVLGGLLLGRALAPAG